MGKALLALMVALTTPTAAGCGSGSEPSESLAPRDRTTSSGTVHGASSGLGMSAPISKVIVASRTRPWHGRPAGYEGTGAKGCTQEKGRGQISVFTDVRAPSCVRITGRQRVMIVNRTSAYRRFEGKRLVVRFGPYSARILPQQAALFGPVGRFFKAGLHQATIDHGVHVGVLILPNECALLRPESGKPLCFRKDRAGDGSNG